MKPMKYREDIDGLRAIAVLLVLAHHSEISLFSGGFIGVDVFFVLSGFLITGVITKEIQEHRFTFSEFYLRRIRRLMPAFITVCLSTSVVAILLFLPDELITYTQSLLTSILYISNFYFAATTDGYFSANTDYYPLLHTWSLAVEEQFYILWPISLYFAYKYIRDKYLFCVASIFFIGLALLSQYLALNNAIDAYYLLPSRGYELIAGGLLSIYFRYIPPPGKKTGHLISTVGLALIIGSGIALDKNSTFPGVNAICACLGTLLLISTGRNEKSVINSILATRLLRHIGLISYSLYLWHWPIFSYMKYIQKDMSAANVLLGLTISIVLAQFTWRFIETPFRHKYKFTLAKSLMLFLLTPTLLASGLWMASEYTNGMPNRLDQSLLTMAEAVESKPNITRGKCHNGEAENPLQTDDCILGLATERIEVLLVGDSHANALTNMIDKFLRDAQKRGLDITRDGTPFLLEASLIRKREKPALDHGFSQRNLALRSIIQSGNFNYVVMAGRWSSYVLGETDEPVEYYLTEGADTELDASTSLTVFKRSLAQSVAFIINAKAIPVIVKEVPVFKETKHLCEFNNKRFRRDEVCTTPYDSVYLYQQAVNTIIDELQNKHPELVIVDPKAVMCDEIACQSTIKNIPLYRDNNHLNDVGAQFVGELYLDTIGNPISGK